MAFSLNLDYRALQRAQQGLVAAVASASVRDDIVLNAGDRILLQALKASAPVGQGPGAGRGRDSISAHGGARQHTYYAARYMVYVDRGTKPHVILPRNARVLRFEVGGDTVFARRVNHPGTKATHWISRAVEAAKPALRVLMLENGKYLARIVTHGGTP